jgi:hypothetical protein
MRIKMVVFMLHKGCTEAALTNHGHLLDKGNAHLFIALILEPPPDHKVPFRHESA